MVAPAESDLRLAPSPRQSEVGRLLAGISIEDVATQNANALSKITRNRVNGIPYRTLLTVLPFAVKDARAHVRLHPRPRKQLLSRNPPRFTIFTPR